MDDVVRWGPMVAIEDETITEWAHRFFSPRTGLFRQFRAELNMAGYTRSALLRYLEEALAEGSVRRPHCLNSTAALDGSGM
jgi:hypothetical protein